MCGVCIEGKAENRGIRTRAGGAQDGIQSVRAPHPHCEKKIAQLRHAWTPKPRNGERRSSDASCDGGSQRYRGHHGSGRTQETPGLAGVFSLRTPRVACLLFSWLTTRPTRAPHFTPSLSTALSCFPLRRPLIYPIKMSAPFRSARGTSASTKSPLTPRNARSAADGGASSGGDGARWTTPSTKRSGGGGSSSSSSSKKNRKGKSKSRDDDENVDPTGDMARVSSRLEILLTAVVGSGSSRPWYD